MKGQSKVGLLITTVARSPLPRHDVAKVSRPSLVFAGTTTVVTHDLEPPETTAAVDDIDPPPGNAKEVALVGLNTLALMFPPDGVCATWVLATLVDGTVVVKTRVIEAVVSFVHSA